MLAEAAILIPKGVICLTSALQFHELTLQMPSAIWIAIKQAKLPFLEPCPLA
jgi:predicted transcriptional regulator of viral defense system